MIRFLNTLFNLQFDRITIFLSIALLSCFLVPKNISHEAHAKKVTVKVKSPKPSVKNPEEKFSFKITGNDTISSKILFLGYDKNASSSVESLFIKNNTTFHISSLYIELNYLTPDGRNLHKRNVKISLSIPAGETRKVDIKTWDPQHNFHYIKSIPSKRPSSPYDLSISLLSATVSEADETQRE